MPVIDADELVTLVRVNSADEWHAMMLEDGAEVLRLDATRAVRRAIRACSAPAVWDGRVDPECSGVLNAESGSAVVRPTCQEKGASHGENRVTLGYQVTGCNQPGGYGGAA